MQQKVAMSTIGVSEEQLLACDGHAVDRGHQEEVQTSERS